MNEKNLDYLKKVLENLGFGTRLNDVLETAVRREIPKFALGLNNTHRPPEVKDQNALKSDNIRFELNFNRAKDSDMYFLNDYKVSLQKSNELQSRVKTFDMERDHRITALQAYKLLSGLSFEKDVYPKAKEGEERTAEKPEKTRVWFKLSLDITDAFGQHPLRTFYPEYNYNLENSLDKYPFKDLKDQARKDEAIKTMAYGNLTEAVLTIGKKNETVWIAANPQMKTIDIYDKNMREIRDQEIFPEKTVSQSVKAETSGGVKNGKDAAIQQAAGQEEQPWKQDHRQENTPAIGR
ncbi:MAG: hypothetical protein V4546_05380 [Bacteroidota bacterium]